MATPEPAKPDTAGPTELDTLRGHFDDPKHEQLGFNFQRCAQIAFAEYDLARSDTLSYLAALPDVSLSDYATALHHWETTLAALWQGRCLLGRFSDPAAKWYENGDGSKFERLNHMYNRIKHVDKTITAGQVLPDSTTPVWLTNEGLKSVDHVLTHEEIAELLTDMEEETMLIRDPVAPGERQPAPKDVADVAEGPGPDRGFIDNGHVRHRVDEIMVPVTVTESLVRCGNPQCPEQPEIIPADSRLDTDDRQPCHVCGSRARGIGVVIAENVILTEMIYPPSWIPQNHMRDRSPYRQCGAVGSHPRPSHLTQRLKRCLPDHWAGRCSRSSDCR